MTFYQSVNTYVSFDALQNPFDADPLNRRLLMQRDPLQGPILWSPTKLHTTLIFVVRRFRLTLLVVLLRLLHILPFRQYEPVNVKPLLLGDVK